MSVPPRPNSARTEAISALMNMSKAVTRVGYVPAEIQSNLSKGIQRPICTSSPSLFSKSQQQTSKKTRSTPPRNVYQRPKRFLPQDPEPIIYKRDLAVEIQPPASAARYRRYPKPVFHVIQSANVSYKSALQSYQNRQNSASGHPEDQQGRHDRADKIGSFQAVQQAARKDLVSTRTAPDQSATAAADVYERPQIDLDHQGPESAEAVTFLTETPFEHGYVQDTSHIQAHPAQEDVQDSPFPHGDTVPSDNSYTEDTRFLYPKILTPDRRRLNTHTQISQGSVGHEFIESTEKYSIGQKRLIAQKYTEFYVSQLPSTLHRMERSGISKRCSSETTHSASIPARSSSNYNERDIQAARKSQENLANMQAELSKMAWESALIKRINVLNAAEFEEVEEAVSQAPNAPAENQGSSPRRGRKRFSPRPRLASMYTTRDPLPIQKTKRVASAQGNNDEVRELVVSSITGSRHIGQRPHSALPKSKNMTSNSSAHAQDPLIHTGSQIYATANLMSVIPTSPSKIQLRTMCEFHRKTARETRDEANKALYSSTILALFTKEGEQQAGFLSNQYTQNHATAARLVLTRILHMCRQYLCMQYYHTVDAVHEPFQPTQLFLEWENHCIVIKTCLQALNRLNFFQLITNKLLYYLPEVFFMGIIKSPCNKLGLTLEALRTCLMLRPIYHHQHGTGSSPKLTTSLSPEAPLLPADSDQLTHDISVSDGRTIADLLFDRKNTIDLSLIELSTIAHNPQDTPYVGATKEELRQASASASAVADITLLPPKYAKVKFSTTTDLEYMAHPTLEVAVAFLSTIARELPVFTGQTKWRPFNDGALFCSIAAFVGACNFDYYYWFITPPFPEDYTGLTSSFSSARVKAKSYQNFGEAPATLVFDYLCYEVIQLLIASYKDTPESVLVYTKPQDPTPPTLTADVVTPITRARPLNTPLIDWSHVSIYDMLIGGVSAFLTNCGKEEFVTEHGFLLQFTPQISFRVFEAAALILKNMPISLYSYYFERTCFMAFCTITFIKGAVVSAATHKVIVTIFQGVSLHDPYTIANAYYLLSVCLHILLDLRAILSYYQDDAKDDHVKFLAYLFSELCTLGNTIAWTHCLSMASGLSLGNLHMLFSSYPSDMSGMLPPFIFFFKGSEDIRHGDIQVDHEQMNIYLKYYVASFTMRLSISFARCLGHLDVPVKDIIGSSKIFSHLRQEYSSHRDSYVLIDEFCRTIFEDNGGLARESAN